MNNDVESDKLITEQKSNNASHKTWVRHLPRANFQKPNRYAQYLLLSASTVSDRSDMASFMNLLLVVDRRDLDLKPSLRFACCATTIIIGYNRRIPAVIRKKSHLKHSPMRSKRRLMKRTAIKT